MMQRIPNYLTTLRIVMVMILVAIWLVVTESPVVLTLGTYEMHVHRLILFVLFAVASLTDFLDGYWARKYHVISTYGKLMDPIADKLLVNTTLVLFAFHQEIPVLIPIIMIGRDTFVDALRMLMAEKQIVIAAGPWGKLKTVLQMIGLLIVFWFGFPLHQIYPQLGIAILWVAAAVSVYSGIDYFYHARKGLYYADSTRSCDSPPD